MRKLLEETVLRLRKRERVVWCVIFSAQGSTPRGIGAKMAVFADGSSCGTIGGGSVELQAISQAKALGRSAAVRSYELYSGGTEATGMICGGVVQVGFFPFEAEALPELEKLLAAANQPGAYWLRLRIEPEGGFGAELLSDPGLHGDQDRPRNIPVLERPSQRDWVLTEPLSRDYRVFIFGGGHVCAALTPLLINLDFPVTVLDPRPELAQASRLPGAQVIRGAFDRLSDSVQITERDYAVVMTPEHTMDLAVLEQLLKTKASYIGCIGSRRKTAYVNQRLAEAGFSEADIRRIHAPIGLPIRAKTPEEIAVSIAAELILHRAGG